MYDDMIECEHTRCRPDDPECPECGVEMLDAVARLVSASDPPTATLDMIERVNALPRVHFEVEGVWERGEARDAPTEPE